MAFSSKDDSGREAVHLPHSDDQKTASVIPNNKSAAGFKLGDDDFFNQEIATPLVRARSSLEDEADAESPFAVAAAPDARQEVEEGKSGSDAQQLFSRTMPAKQVTFVMPEDQKLPQSQSE